MIKKEIREQIVKEYKNTTCSLNCLQEKYKISRNTISKIIRENGLSTKFFKKHLIDEKDVVSKYVVDRMRPIEIANIYHCSTHPINNILKKFGVKRKQAESLKGVLVGEKNPNWKGGITKYDEYIKKVKGFKYKMRIWSGKILERDGICCKLCGSDEKLEAHHIIPVRKLLPDELFILENGITLCKKCHSKIHLKEQKYEKIFRKLISGPV